MICLPLSGKVARNITYCCMSVLTILSAAVLLYTMSTGESFTYRMGHFPSMFGNEIRAGVLEGFMALLFSLVSLLSLVGGCDGIFEELPKEKVNTFYLMMNMLLSAMLAIIYTNDIFTAYVFIEIVTITACYIVSAKPGGRPMVASMVYLFMSLIGSCLFLISVAILYGVTGHLLMPGLRDGVGALAATGEYRVPLFMLSAMMTAGFAIKSALFPFHSWLPDAHSSATTSASAVLSGLIIKCYFLLLMKMQLRVFGLDTMSVLHIPDILVAFGAAAIIYGSIKAMQQGDIKRMLSFSSISQVGFISVAVGLNTEAGVATACFHIAAHAVGKAMLFVAAGGLSAASGHKKDYGSLYGAGRRDPLSGTAFIIGALAMTGIPPFFGFASKMNLTVASMDTPYAIVIIVIALIAGTVMSAMYYFPMIARIVAKTEADSDEPAIRVKLSLSYKAAIGGFLVATVVLSIFSSRILHIIEQGISVFS